MNTTHENIKLTQYSHGAGCGCKIAPKVLDEILSAQPFNFSDPALLVGNHSRDDAAVYDQGNGTAIISTTDFFMPIVDDPYDFGRIAAVNAISDIYAMGGKPVMAIAILGWPIDKLPPEVAGQVIQGGRQACKEAGIMLAGGHSIDAPEPIFGLAVTGTVATEKIKRNNTARPGDLLFLTKPLGVGVITTAQKKGLVSDDDLALARNSMLKLNNIGEVLSEENYVHAMTDVTGFGLLGHLTEVCQGSKCSADVYASRVPRFPVVDQYIEQGAIPGGTNRNFASYGHHISNLTASQKALLCDPQTSGGLLVAVAPEQEQAFLKKVQETHRLELTSIGTLKEATDPLITVHS